MKNRGLSWFVYSALSMGVVYYCLFSLTRLIQFLATFNIVL